MHLIIVSHVIPLCIIKSTFIDLLIQHFIVGYMGKLGIYMDEKPTDNHGFQKWIDELPSGKRLLFAT